MTDKCIYQFKNGTYCQKRALIPFINRRYCFKHRKSRDPYVLLSKKKTSNDYEMIFDLYNFK